MNITNMIKSKAEYLAIILLATFVLACAGTALPQTAFAAGDVQANISMDYFREEETTAVIITFSGDNLSRVNASFSYDPNLLIYEGGGSSKEDNGTVHLSMAGDGSGSIVYTLKFTGKKAGMANFTLETYEAYDMDDVSMTIPDATAHMEINQIPVEGDQSAAQDPTDKDKEQGQDKGTDSQKDKDKKESKESFTIVGYPWQIFAAGGGILLVLIIAIAVMMKGKRKG